MLINFEEVKYVNKFSKKNLLETKSLERDEGETNIFRTLYLFYIKCQMKEVCFYTSYAKIHTDL